MVSIRLDWLLVTLECRGQILCSLLGASLRFHSDVWVCFEMGIKKEKLFRVGKELLHFSGRTPEWSFGAISTKESGSVSVNMNLQG